MEFAPKTILSLIDLSQASTNVLHWTRLFADKFGSEVQILHAMWPPVLRTVTKAEGGRDVTRALPHEDVSDPLRPARAPRCNCGEPYKPA